MEGKGKGKKEQAAINVWDCGSPLYDSYEIASLGHLIDRHSLALPSPCGPEKEGRVVIDYASMPRDQEKAVCRSGRKDCYPG
ncbi:SERINE/THREONINE-KINASE [Salix koriyanagi]|uniref:SERINE/THREONINE-KINASE n=1 Tax=Salix koriyanagi TaxID=2511006 RepID=A0A9Q0Q8H2_9ROSI|nr:SERINE/THREONINE-KINASE [Salix koriyanagi]